MGRRITNHLQAYEEALASGDEAYYVLRLYVTGATPRSTRAIFNIKSICEQHLPGRYDLEVIDLYQQPALGQEQQILAAPTLVKALPSPLRKLVGDMSDRNHVLMGLGLRT
jgi:circadian clock protein KaiB